MKKAEISTSMLVWIVIAVIAMVVFIIFFTGRGAGLFGQFKEAGPSESDTARDACQIACNMAKANNDCAGWCSKKTSSGAKCSQIIFNCAVKKADGAECTCGISPLLRSYNYIGGCGAACPAYNLGTCIYTLNPDGTKGGCGPYGDLGKEYTCYCEK